MPLVSVVIPLYNKEPHIKRAIDSILAQKIQDFEIIVIDDGSTDKSADIVKSFTDPRIRLIQQENAGVSAARNRGVQEAKTDMIAFLDADDEWKPEFLETILRLRKNHPEAGAYAAAYEKCDENGITIRIDYREIPSAPWEGLLQSYFLTAALGKMPISASSVCVPKTILLKYGGFQEGVWVWEDSELWGKIALQHEIAFSQKVGSVYHTEAVNRACNRKLPVKEHPFIKVASNAIKNKEVSDEILRDLKEYIARLEINFASNNIINENKIEALKILLKCKTKLLRFELFSGFIMIIIPSKFWPTMSKIKRKFSRFI